MKKYSASAERNREAIAVVLARILPAPGTVLEIGSGTGQHVVAFAGAMPSITWLPSDVEEAEIDSIAAYRADAALPNLRSPLRLDARRAEWDLPPLAAPLRAVLAIDVVSSAPWPVGVGLMTGAATVLPVGGQLVLYGSTWPRPLEELEKVAHSRGFESVPSPAEGFLLFRRG